MSAGALAGVRIIDMTTVIMGPYATAMLADFGADVVKVEPLTGDMTRGVGAARHPGMTAMTLSLQRNKRSIALDVASEEGAAVLGDLIRSADVVVTNLRPRSRSKLGLDPEKLLVANPRLVICTAQAYGSETDRRDEPAYDDIVQAASGFAMIGGLVDGRPAYTPSVIADKVSGLHIVIGILAALQNRERTGRGQHVDVPMVDTMIAFNLVEHLAGHTFDPPAGSFGWHRVLVPERKPHRTADGWICLMPYSHRNWRDFFQIAGRPDLADDPRFATVDARHRHMGTLLTLVDTVTPTRTTAEWMDICAAHDIPASPLLDLSKVQEDDYVRSRPLLFERRDHPTEGAYFASRTPLTFSDSPIAEAGPAPQLGEQTAELLTEIGYSDTRIADLAESGVVARPAMKKARA
ncbi:CaiB/BaiF CoA transferase family protein [Nocardia pseudovaccinii]|uniref:CaiB/BaiF CoA transferase family protein n=1 Tax=Nocardia pseudovaccinii TaxID=189540 RepID=UPI003D8B74D5